MELRLSSLNFRRLFSWQRDHIWYQEHTHTTQSYRSTLRPSNSWQQHVRMEKLAENDLTYFYLRHVVIVVTAFTTISLTPLLYIACFDFPYYVDIWEIETGNPLLHRILSMVYYEIDYRSFKSCNIYTT